MPAEVINLCESRRKKPVEEKSSDADSSAEVISLCDARRLRSARKSGDRLKGLGYPDDFGFGPDEPGEDFGTLFYNLSLDNPNFPYVGDSLPKKDDMDWVKGIMDDDKEHE